MPIGLILSFCVLLTTLDLLGTPINPARNQHLGWQSWDVVRYPKVVKPGQQVVSPGSLTGSKPGDDANDTSDLFDSDDDDSTSFAPSLPLDNWDPLLPHATGISEITVMPCFFPPWIYPRLCSPPTTPEQDKLKGRWVRVERDLNVKSGLWYLVSSASFPLPCLGSPVDLARKRPLCLLSEHLLPPDPPIRRPPDQRHRTPP